MVCIVLPLVVLNLFIFFLATSTPRVELTVGDTKDYKSLDISIKVKSLLPVKSLKVTLESNEVELERNKNTPQRSPATACWRSRRPAGTA